MSRQMLEEESPPQGEGGGEDASDEEQPGSSSSRASSLVTGVQSRSLTKSLGKLDRTTLLGGLPLSAGLKPAVGEVLAESEERASHDD